MSYYSSTLLDFYGSTAGSAGSTSRYDSIYGASYAGKTSTYGSTSYGAGSSAIDRYYSYLDDISTPSSSRSSYLSDHTTPMSSRYSSRYSSTVSDTSGYSSGSASGSGSRYTSDYSSRYSRPIISRAPTYDKYGKELSNYDRWRLQHGEHLDLNSNFTNYRTTNDNETKVTSGRRRISRIENAVEPERSSEASSSSVTSSMLNTSRELSVMPGASRDSYVQDLTALPSRFASLTTSGGRSERNEPRAQKERGRSMAPTSTSSYTASFGGKSYSSGSNSNSRIVHSFPLSVSSKLAGYEVRDVKGDGGCYYRCLSVYFTGTEENYNKYRREVVSYIREHSDNYSTMIRSEVGYASTSDYFSRKLRTDHQEFAETTEIIATCCVYNINVHVLARVPGKGTWEWLHFDPSIGSGKPSTASRDIYLYNQGSVHFMLCTPK